MLFDGMRGIRARVVVSIIAVACAISSARANVVVEWNNITLDLIRAEALPPPKATRVLAMVHVAMFDAVNAKEREYEPYLIHQHGLPFTNRKVAAAAAAHKVLIKSFPEHKPALHAALHEEMDKCASFLGKLHGRIWGRFCGKRVWQARKHDGSEDVVSYTPSGMIGFWKPTPPGFAPALLPNWATIEPFCMMSPDQFRAPAPPSLNSAEFAEAYNEVKDLGRFDSVSRTEDETIIACFWEDGAGTVTPPGHWHVIAQLVADDLQLNLTESARLFALLALAQADAAISAWDSKYAHDFVRPVTSIQEEGDLDSNPDTAADATWLPLLPTPPFPSYTSGHSTFSSVSARILANFVGMDDYMFEMESPDPDRWPDVLPGVVRSWNSFSQAAEEAGMSRIYGGIHFQFDNTAGLAAGEALADFVFEHYLTPN